MESNKLSQYFVYSFNKDKKSFDSINSKYNGKILWKCDKNHLSLATYVNYKNKGCKKCRREIFLSVNSLAFKNPELSQEWDTELNKISPKEISSGASGKFYWRCQNNHSFVSTLNNRKNRRVGCPYCDGRLVGETTKNLGDLNEKIIKYWGCKNKINFTEIPFAGSKDKIFWWRCTKGRNHEFEMKVSKFLEAKHPCQLCNRQILRKGYNDFQSIFPHFAVLWSSKLNNIAPDEVNVRAKKKYYFNCPNGYDHITENSIYDIFKSSQLNCKVCNNLAVIYKINDLYSNHNNLMKHWSIKNHKSPKKISMNSNENFLWTNNCDYMHTFKRSVKNMINNQNCPYCEGILLLKDFNDFKSYCLNNSKYKFLLEEWDYNKNQIRPDEITYKYSKEVYWKCKHDHEFKMRLSPRINRNSSCISCNKSNGVSKNEIKFYNKISNFLPQYNFQANNRIELNGLELDLFDDKQKIAIEYNGDYWHDEKIFKTVFDRHERKMLQCRNKDILLIVIWESYWLDNESKVMNDIKWMIHNKSVKFEYTYDFKRD